MVGVVEARPERVCPLILGTFGRVDCHAYTIVDSEPDKAASLSLIHI